MYRKEGCTMAWEEKRGAEDREPEQERDPGRNKGPFSPDGEYDSLEAWADEEER
jgi:hypothetical protein